MVEGNTKEDRQWKEQKIEQYLEEYRQKLGSRETLDSKPNPVEGIEDILDEFRARSSQQQVTPEQPISTSETWLPDKISEEELNDFDSGDLLEGNLEGDLEGNRGISGEVPDNETAQLYESAKVLVLESIRRAEKDQPPMWKK